MADVFIRVSICLSVPCFIVVLGISPGGSVVALCGRPLHAPTIALFLRIAILVENPQSGRPVQQRFELRGQFSVQSFNPLNKHR